MWVLIEFSCSRKSNFLIGVPRKKRRKEEEYKELELSNYDFDVRNAELVGTIDQLKDRIIEYKEIQRDGTKYKQI